MYYSYSTIQKETRNKIKEIYPAVFTSIEYQTIFYWLLTQDLRFITGDSERFAHCLFVADMLGKDPTNFSTFTELTNFERDTGIKLNLGNYSYSKGQARTLNSEVAPE